MRARILVIVLAAACTEPPVASTPDAGPPPLMPMEIVTPTPLLAADGTLAAHGWARGPLMQYDRASFAPEHADRVREWEYFAIFAPTFAAAVTIADLGILTIATISVQDYATGEVLDESLLGGPGDLVLPSTPFESTTWATSGGDVEHRYEAGTRTIRFRAGAVDVWELAEAALTIPDDPAGESIAVVTRFDPPGLFFYENKRVGLAATGSIRIGDSTFTLPDEGAYAVIDWGRGAWPEEVTWEWAAASGDSGGHRIGINLGSVHGDDSHGTADAIVVDGVLHKIDRVLWSFDPADLEAPWRFTSTDGRLDLTLAPDFDESSTLDLGRRYSMSNTKMHGTFSGTVELDDGSILTIGGVRGAAEQVHIMW